MPLDIIIERVNKWINENTERSASEVYETFVEFVKMAAPTIDSKFKRIDKWSIEVLDNAVDSLCDYLNGNSAVLVLWDDIWDAKVEGKGKSISKSSR
ncbi:MAG: hypothetical protein N3D82_05395 [Ignisphaera sp.]|nr:hypothetical protein [Ignisphaera sp.]MCX8168441.1 hypothetical protein [Ignisphaera sp.]MDW8085119.1 hypothetical protein [Ignisphaera sp.]